MMTSRSRYLLRGISQVGMTQADNEIKLENKNHGAHSNHIPRDKWTWVGI